MLDNSKSDVVISAITELLKRKENVIVAIDGRCASGKTTLAFEIAERLDCNVFHMDDFFLRPEQRTDERLKRAGENIDHERFLSEVLEPICRGEDFSYRPYSCHTRELSEAINVRHKRVSLIEGAYSCHPNLVSNYDLRVFSDVESDEQLRRIEKRNGREGLIRFKDLWIPLEEKYFEACGVRDACDICIK